MTTTVAIAGGTGRLGSVIRDVLDGEEDFDVVAVLTSTSDLNEMLVADLVVDATTPGVSVDVVRFAIEHGKNVLVGTSGWSAERIALVRPLVEAHETGIVFIPNFSLGSVIGSALAAVAAPHFPSIEIVEAHRETKVDSPSGTAVRTAELIAAARSEQGPVDSPHVDQRARGQQIASIPVHSLRRPGVIARQETILSGPGESLTITHDTTDPALAYAPGIRVAARAASDARGVIVGLDSLIHLGITPRTAKSAGTTTPVDDQGVPGQVARSTGA